MAPFKRNLDSYNTYICFTFVVHIVFEFNYWQFILLVISLTIHYFQYDQFYLYVYHVVVKLINKQEQTLLLSKQYICDLIIIVFSALKKR